MSKFHEQKKQKQEQIGYFYTNAQIRAIREEATRRGIQEALHIFCGLICLVLHNSFGFGRKRCEAVCDRVLCMFGKMDVGGYTLQEIKKAAWDYGNVKTIL